MAVARLASRVWIAVCSAWLLAACTTTAAPLGKTCVEPLPELFERASPSVVMITGQSINPYRLLAGTPVTR